LLLSHTEALFAARLDRDLKNLMESKPLSRNLTMQCLSLIFVQSQNSNNVISLSILGLIITGHPIVRC